MEIDLNWISHDANVYDVRKSVELVLHGPGLYHPDDGEHNGRKPNFQVVMGQPESADRLHNGTAILRVTTELGLRFLQWIRESDDHNVVVCGCPLRISNTYRSVPLEVKLTLEKARYINSDQDRFHAQKGDYCGQVRLRIAKIQLGVWYTDPNAPQSQRRAFSIEYEREVFRPTAANITFVYENSLIRIDVSVALSVHGGTSDVYPTQIGQRETKENNFLIIVKFSNIRKLGIGHDEFGQPCAFFWHRCCGD